MRNFPILFSRLLSLLYLVLFLNTTRVAQSDSPLELFKHNPDCQSLKPLGCQQSKVLISSAWCQATGHAYVKNPKADSKRIKRLMLRACQGPVLPSEFFASMRVPSNGTPGAQPTRAFTVVRDPWERALSSYGEVDAKCSKMCAGKGSDCFGHATWHRINDGDEPRRFLGFLQDWQSNRIPKVCQPAHAQLQLSVVCSIPKQSLVSIYSFEQGHLEQIESILNQTGIDGKIHSHRRSLATWSYNQRKQHDRESVNHLATLNAPKYRAALLAVCRMYFADYTCFGYAIPEACKE